MASTSDCLHFHHSNPTASSNQEAQPHSAHSSSNLFFSGRVSEPTAVSTTMGPITDPTLTGQAQLGPNPARVSKPARKRTRASRRTPTTLLNTDTANFRAMVQQFTGGPSNNFDITGPSPHMFRNGLGRGYGLQLSVGQLQQQPSSVLSPFQYSISSNNNNNNSNNNNNHIMFMQNDQSFTTTDHRGSNNVNGNMRLTGTGGGSSSSENRSIDSFHF